MGGHHGGVALRCDRCEALLTGLCWRTVADPSLARVEAMTVYGWSYISGEDLCPSCHPMKDAPMPNHMVALQQTDESVSVWIDGIEVIVAKPDNRGVSRFLITEDSDRRTWGGVPA